MIRGKRKYIIYSIILLLVVSLSVGFSAFQKQLLIDDSIFNVRLQVDTRVSGNSIQKTSGNAISNSEDYNVKKIYGNVTFPTTSSYVLYKVDLTNYGNVKTGLLDITSNSTGINYSICDSNGNNCTSDPKTSVCNGSNCTLGSTKTIYVKVTSTSTGTKNVDLDLEFATIHTVTYENFRESTSSFKTDIMEGETYEVTLTSSPEEVSGTNATANYNSSNNKLTITNVTNDSTITAKYLFTDVAETSYTGSNPNNYVRFNNTLFRIITKETINDGYGNSDLRGKIIANTSIGNNTFDTSSNDFGVSSLANTLNTTYYNSLNETSQRLIGTALWTEDYADYVGLIKSSDFTSNSSWLTNTQYTLTPGTGNNITAIISGSLTNSAVTVSRATYPVMYLSEKVLIIGGSGTSTDPYILGLSDNGDIPNPTKIEERTLTVNGSAQELVTVTNKVGTPRYSTTTVLNSSNYMSGSTSIPTASSVGNYTIYYYIPPMEGIKAKQGTAHTTISGITYTINYAKGDHVSSIGKTSDTCTTTGSNTTCSVTLPSITPTSGWTNGLWSYGSNTYNPGASFTLNSSNNNGTLTANANTMTYTVAFNANGGTGGQSASVTAINGEPMPTISTTAPTMDGYTFMGWYDNQVYTSGTQYYTAAGASARNYDKTSGTTLYAGWKINNPATPTISGGGDHVYGSGSQLTCSTTTTYATGTTLYYSFGYTTTSGGTVGNWSTASTSATYTVGNTTQTRYYACRVYATNTTLSQTSSTVTGSTTQFRYVNARIDFDATTNGGTISGTTPLYARYGNANTYTTRTGTTTRTKPTATKTGWTFDGWYTQATGGTKVIASNGTVQANVSGWTNASSQFILTNASDTQNTNRLYAQFVGNTYTATFYYNSNTTSGSLTVATATSSCTVSSGTSCVVNIPQVVLNSVGKYNSTYGGVTTSLNSMSRILSQLEISGNTTYYTNYSSAITIYYPNSSNGISNSATALYRNEYFTSTTAMNAITSNANDSAAQATSVTLTNSKGTFVGLETAANTYSNKYALNNTTNVLNTNRTTYYAVVTATENAVIHYNSNTTNGSFTDATANAAATSTYYCASTSAMGTSHGTTTTVPTAVSNSVGKYNSAFKGISSSSSGITDVTTFTGGSTYYAYYSSPITIYYPKNDDTITSSNTSLYRNEYYSSTTAMTTKTATSATSTTQATSVTLSNLKGTFQGLETGTGTYSNKYAVNNTNNVINTNRTTYYAVTSGSETVTFRYNNNTTCGSVTLTNNTSTTVTSTFYCSSTSSMGTSHGTTTTVPTAVSNSKGQYNSNYRAVAAVNSLTPVTTFSGGSTYYAIYSSNVTNYYYGSSYTNRTVYRNEYLASSDATSYTSVIATANNSTSNYTTANGPGSSAWVGLADTNTTTVKYSSVANAATSNTCTTTLYSIYQFSINYQKGSNVSSIGKTSDVCNLNHNTTSCTVVLPTITPNTGYTSVGWSTTNGDTTGTAAGQNYTIANNSTIPKLYANAIQANYQNTSTNASYETLNAAFSAVANNQTIKVLNNKTETTNATLASGKTGIKLDLNGKTITMSNKYIDNNGTLDIYNTSSTNGTINGGTSYVLNNNGTLTLNGTSSTNKIIFNKTGTDSSDGTITNATSKSLTINNNVEIQSNSRAIYNNGTTTINGGTITGSSYGIDNYGNITVSGGSIAGSDYGLYNIGTATISGSGTQITGYEGIRNSGTATVTGGTITGSSTGINNSMSTISGTSYYGNLTITGGTIQSSGGNGISVGNGTTVTLGTKDSSVSTSSPLIQTTSSSNKYGIHNINGGTLNYYDGIIKSSSGTGYSLYGTAADTPTNYFVYKETTSGVESAYLVKQAILMSGTSAAATEVFLRTNTAKQDIERITFTNSLSGHTANGTDCFDVSKDSDGSVLAWVTDTNSNGKYEVTIGALGKVYANSGYNLFKYLTNLTTITGWEYLDTSKVTDMDSMFSNCSSLTSVNLSYFNTSKVTDMRNMFYNCPGLTSINFKLSNFDTSKVKYMSNMFYGCSGLTSLDLTGSNFDTSNVTNMIGMFYGCTGLTSLNLKTSNFDTSNVTYMTSMFYNCTSLTTLDLTGTNFNTSKVTDMTSMFYNCTSLTTLDLTGTNINTSLVTNMNNMFYGCTNLSSLNLSTLNTTSVTNMSNMFRNCTSLTSLDLTGSNFDTSSVTNMSYMFYGCTNLSSLNLSTLNTTSVTNMSYMFRDCTSLTSLDLTGSNFNTSLVTNMSNMFYGCSGLTSLDLTGSNFDTSSVTNMSYMFYECTNLAAIYAEDNFDTSAVTSSSNMFYNNNSLVGGAGTVYTSSNPRDKTYAHLDEGATNPGYFANKRQRSAVFYYNSNTTSGSLTVSTAIASCTATTDTGSCTVTVPSVVSSSVGKYNSAYAGVSRSTGNLTSGSLSLSFSQVFYTYYRSNVTNYYYGTSYTNRTLRRTEFFTSNTAMDAKLSTSTTGTTNYTTAGGPNGSTWYGLSTAQDSTREYSTVQAAANSNSTTLYTVYSYNINFSKGANVSAIGSDSSHCEFTTSNTSCTVILPTITPKTGYTSVGWNTTSGATTGTAAGQPYTVTTNTTVPTLYANAKAPDPNYLNTNTNTYYETLNDAFSAVASNQTIKVMQNTTETTEATLSNTKTGIKLDLNGKTISFDHYYIVNRGGLDIYNSSSVTGIIEGNNICTIQNDGTLTTNNTSSSNNIIIRNISPSSITNASVIHSLSTTSSTILNTNTLLTFTSDTTISDKSLIRTNGSVTIAGATLTNNASSSTNDIGIELETASATLTMTSGTINTYGYAIHNISSTSSSAITISGGTITSSNSDGISNSSSGEINISNGLISGTNGINNISSGMITITGGTISGTSSGISNSSSGEINVSGSSTQITGSSDGIYNSGTATISGGTITGTSYGIRNLGTTTITGGVIRGNYGIDSGSASSNLSISGISTQIIGTSDYGLRIAGTTVIDGGTITGSSDGIGMLSDGSLEITGGTITGGQTGIYNNNGTINISGSSTQITGTTQYGLWQNQANGNTTITGGTINGASHGIYLNGGTLTLGTKDSSVSTSSPLIQTTSSSNKYGVDNYNGTFNFYDGVIKSSSGTGYAIFGTVADTPTGYSVYKETTSGVESAYLVGTYLNTSTGVSYTTLSSAFSAVASNQTIKVLQNTTETTQATLASGKTGVKLDLNGKTITSSATKAIENNGGLDIYNTSSTTGIIAGSGTYVVYNSGTFTTNATSSTDNIILRNTSSESSARVLRNESTSSSTTLHSNSTLTFTTGTTAVRYVIYSKGSLTVSGGTITSNASETATNDRGILLDDAASTFKITSGTINTGGHSIFNNASTGSSAVNINGGTITSTNGNGFYNYTTGTVKMTAGTISGNGGIINKSSGVVIVTGGTINAKVSALVNNDLGTITIGTKDSTVSTTNPSLITTNTTDSAGVINAGDGYLNFYDGVIKSSGGSGTSIMGSVTDRPDNYAVHKTLSNGVETAILETATRNYQNTTTSLYFETLPDALYSAANNQTIKVLNNKTETEYVKLPSTKTGIKLDLNGKTITLSSVNFEIRGTLDIYNTSSTTGRITGGNHNVIENYGTLTLNGTSSTNTIKIDTTLDDNTGRGGTIYNYNSANLTINNNVELSGNTAINSYGTTIVTGGNIEGKTPISNVGTINISGSTTKLVSSSTSGSYTGLSNSGTATISGGTISGPYGINAQSGSTTNISGSATKITGTYQYGILMYGTLKMSSGTVTGKSAGINVTTASSGSGTATITGGTVTCASNSGLNISSGATLTLGTNNSTVSTTTPTIESTFQPTSSSKRYGVTNDGGTFNFYDGRVRSSSGTGYSIKGTVTDTPTGYTVQKTTSGGVETAKLVSGSKSGTNSSDNAGTETNSKVFDGVLDGAKAIVNKIEELTSKE